MNPIQHVAIIMDGNGRWGKKHKNSRELFKKNRRLIDFAYIPHEKRQQIYKLFYNKKMI